jgi:hypothetical protein
MKFEGAEFDILGPKTRFERTEQRNFLNAEVKILGPK